jgi:diadenosine tetraphosphate (Ap4A) HIT family hydrolase
LCTASHENLIWQGEQLRVIRADDAHFPAFYRVIWQQHAAEFSDLCAAERASCMAAVVAVEQVLRTQLTPHKVNLASLGNMVPHVHWHVIARFEWDTHFPQPIWAPPQRPPNMPKLQQLGGKIETTDAAIRLALGSAWGA